ncbi:hypothetical protein AQ1_00073 [alpha proteobacterium Q-1]|nr:hypothetical protein AQ1_00073 [alpha proteobacterium Q-1]
MAGKFAPVTARLLSLCPGRLPQVDFSSWSARTTLDVATYEINLPGIADAIIERAAAGVPLLADFDC